MAVIDTSVLVALIDEDDAHHEDAVRAVRGLDQFIVPEAVLAEFHNVQWARLRRMFGSAKAARKTRQIIDAFQAQASFQVHATREPDRVLETYARHRPLSYADAVGIRAARERRAPLLTFDKAQVKAARA